MIGLFYCFIEAILPYLSKFYKSKLVSVLYGILEIQIKCEYTKPEEHMEKQINEKIIEIVHQANDMIPVEWDDLYIGNVRRFWPIDDGYSKRKQGFI